MLIAPRKAEAYVAVRVERVVEVAVAHLQVVHEAVEAPAPHHAVGTARTRKSSIIYRCAGITSEQVPAPFKHITRHIINTQRICCFSAYCLCTTTICTI